MKVSVGVPGYDPQRLNRGHWDKNELVVSYALDCAFVAHGMVHDHRWGSELGRAWMWIAWAPVALSAPHRGGGVPSRVARAFRPMPKDGEGRCCSDSKRLRALLARGGKSRGVAVTFPRFSWRLVELSANLHDSGR